MKRWHFKVRATFASGREVHTTKVCGRFSSMTRLEEYFDFLVDRVIEFLLPTASQGPPRFPPAVNYDTPGRKEAL